MYSTSKEFTKLSLHSSSFRTFVWKSETVYLATPSRLFSRRIDRQRQFSVQHTEVIYTRGCCKETMLAETSPKDNVPLSSSASVKPTMTAPGAILVCLNEILLDLVLSSLDSASLMNCLLVCRRLHTAVQKGEGSAVLICLERSQHCSCSSSVIWVCAVPDHSLTVVIPRTVPARSSVRTWRAK